MREQRFLQMLVECLQLLAADYETQVATLPSYVHIPDELALNYHDCILLMDQITKSGLLNERVATRLTELDSELAEMSGANHASLWTLNALMHDDTWNGIRQQAIEILSLLGQRKETPRLGSR